MPKVSLLAASVLVLLAAGVAAAGDVEDAAALRAAGQHDEAAAKYRAAIAADPANEAAALGLSESLHALRKYDEAASCVDAALAKHPGSAGLILAKARALVDGADAAAARRTVDIAVRPEVEAKTTEARKWVDQLLAADAKSVAARILDARIVRYEQGEESADVRGRLERVVADAPNDAEANFQLGMLLFRAAGRSNRDKSLWAAAETTFRAAFAADPTNGTALLNAAYSAAWQGRYDSYVADMEKAAELLPGDESALVAITKYFQKNPAKRIPIFERLRAKHPEDAAVLVHLAFTLNDVGRDEEGLKLIQEQCAKYPESAATAYELASYRLAGGKKAEAVEAALRAAQLCTGAGDRPVYDRLDRMVVRTNQFTPEQRDAIWSALLAARPDEVIAPNNAGIWFRDVANDPVKSLAWFHKALEVAPEDVMLMNDIALSYQSSAEPDVDTAEEYLNKAIVTAQKNGIARPDRSKGYSLAVDNLVKLLASQKRVQDLLALSKKIEADPRSGSIVQLAESLRR